MAYYIFLKSLRSPEEFRKNPHVKISPKSPCANFQSILYSKIQFLFENNSPQISARPAQPLPRRPATPAGRCARARPIRPERLWRICQKAPLLRVCAVRQRRFLSHVTAMWGPPVSSIPLPEPAEPNPVATSPRRIRSPRATRPLALRCQSRPLTPPP
jgi:hypothetical protein